MTKKKINIITAVFTITLLLIFSGFITTKSIRNSIKDKLINEYAEQEHLIAVQLAQVLELEISQRQSELKLIANLPEITSGSTEVCNSKLKEVFENPKNKIGNYGRIDENGFFKCSLNQKLIGIKGNTLGTYVDDIFNDPEHKPVMSRSIKPVGANSYLVAIHVPVFDDQENFIGTIGGAIYLNDLQEKYLKNIEIMNGGSIAIYDDDGTILNHYKPELIGTNLTSPEFQKLVAGTSPPDKILKDIKNGISGTRRYFFEGVEKIAAYEPVNIFPNRNWRILVTLPTSIADDNIIKIGADKVLSGLPILFSVIILILFSLFLYLIKRKV